MRPRLFDKLSMASILGVLAMFLLACSDKSIGSEETESRQEIAALWTDSVTTLISDSGITRYRISSPQWLVYDKTDPP